METKRSTTPAAEEILGLYFPVLDHGFVALVDYMGGDADIEQAARVAYGQGTRKVSETRGLIRYLHRHKHTSPFEMVELKFHCSMPIFVARQWIRHRTANVNEMSGRYSIMPMLFYTPPEEQLRAQSTVNKQGREGEIDSDHKARAYNRWRGQREDAVENYNWLCENDFARELARIDLPLSTYTQWYWKIDLHNLLHFLTLRVDSHAQWEIQQFGKVMAGMLKRVAPLSYGAWIDYDVCGVHLSWVEVNALRYLLSTETHLNHLSASGREERRVSYDGLLINGASAREATNFLDRFRGMDLPQEIPDFELDLSQAKPASFFEAQAAVAVPR